MSSCDNSNIKQNYIVTNTNEFDTITACTGIWTSNIYGCSPVTIQDPLRLNSVSNNNILNRLLVLDPVTKLVEYRDAATLVTGATTVVNFTYNGENTFIITRSDSTQFSATFNTVTGLTVNGNLFITGTTEVVGDIIPLFDGNSNVGTPIKRFRDVNTLSGTSTVWTSTVKVITPSLDLGLDTNGDSRIINANNSIIQNDILLGGTY